jgi:hypothetical protein
LSPTRQGGFTGLRNQSMERTRIGTHHKRFDYPPLKVCKFLLPASPGVDPHNHGLDFLSGLTGLTTAVPLHYKAE